MTDLYCPHCDYNLAGSKADVCPECGGRFHRDALANHQMALEMLARGARRDLFKPPLYALLASCIPYIGFIAGPVAAIIIGFLSIGFATDFAGHRAIARRRADKRFEVPALLLQLADGIGFFAAQIIVTVIAIIPGCVLTWFLWRTVAVP